MILNAKGGTKPMVMQDGKVFTNLHLIGSFDIRIHIEIQVLKSTLDRVRMKFILIKVLDHYWKFDFHICHNC